MRKTIKNTFLPLISFSLCAILVLLLFVFNGFQPFGTKSLVTADAAIQYLDFFAYYKDTLAGNNSFFYTFGKTLGGNCIAVFSYYLASPFTILYALFPTTSYYAVFDIIFLLKVSLAAASMCIFLQYRFKDKTDNTSLYITILLSLSYALSQYTIAQSSNTMWLEGVYMLPLILMGISRLVHEQKIIMLSVTVGLAIIFNWYSAGMNCVFAIIWFFCEYLAYRDKNCGFLKCCVSFAVSMLLGVGLSAVLFLPTIKALGTGSRGGLQLGQLLNLSIIGYPKAILKNYYYGRTSGFGDPALYCGLFSLVSCTAYFFSKNSRHWTGVILIIFMCLMLFWNPIVTIFSLFKIVSSYWYRYGYICIFIILFLAQEFLCNCSEKDTRIPLFSGIILALIYPCLWFNQISTHIPLILRNMALFILSGGILTLFLKYRKTGSYAAVILLLLGVFDNMINYHLVSKSYYSEDTSFRDYAAEAKEAIDHIHNADAGNYRISQTAPRIIQDNGMTAFYNEALSYNYMSISGYTSSPDDNQKYFLDNIGYRWNSSNYNITNAPVISADALLGVKYTLSPYGVKGLIQESEETYNGRYIFSNPYALPMSFVYTSQEQTLDNTDPFIYQNGLYKLLTGNTKDIYIKLDPQANVTDTDMTITLDIPQGNYAVYGNMPWVSPAAYSTLNVNNVYTIGYSAWGSPSVFPIPYEGDIAAVNLHCDALASEAYTLQYYALDLDLLEEYSAQIKAHVPDNESIENGRVSITVNDAREGEELFISVPQDPGWEVTVNGQPAEYELIGDCMYSFTLTKGENIIDMKYHVPGLILGMVCSVCSVIILVYLDIRMKIKL